MRVGRAIVVAGLAALTALGLASLPLDAVVLLDESGSMYGNPRRGELAQDPEFLRFAAVQCLARKMRPGDRIAVLPFGSKALPAARVAFTDPFSTQGVDWSPLARRAGEGAARQDATNYADALRAARDLLGKPNPARTRVAILLSDGVPNAPGSGPDALEREVARLARDTGARLYTLGLGPDVRMDLLRDLSAGANGRAFPAPKAGDLPFALATVFREAAGREVQTPKGRRTFVVGPNARELHAVAVARAGGNPFALIAPDGARVTPTEEPPVYAEGQPDHVRWLRVPAPLAGEWRIEGDPATIDLGYESALRARLGEPADGDLVPNSAPLRVTMTAEGGGPSDRLGGEATFRGADGRDLVLPLRFAGARGGATFALEDAPLGAADLTVRIWRDLTGGREEGVPVRASLTVVASPPGVPTAILTWPKSAEIRVGAEERARVLVRYAATKEAVGKSLRFRANGGMKLDQSVVLARNGTLDLELRGPYEGGRGEFPTTVAAEGPSGLVVTNPSSRVTVRATNWFDVWYRLFLGFLPFVGAALLLLVYIALARARSNRLNDLRRKTLRGIELLAEGENVARDNGKPLSLRRRTFGDKTHDATVALEPEVQGLLLTAAIPGRSVRPKELAFSGVGIRTPGSDTPRTTVVVGSDTPTELLVPDSLGNLRALTARFRYDAGLARRIELLDKISLALGVLFVLALVLGGVKYARDLDSRTSGGESARTVR